MTDDPRRVALRALRRIDEGAYANLVLPPLLERSDMERRDRDFVTELVYGTTRMRKACDWLIDQHVDRELDPDVRNTLRLGAYQLRFLGTPPHAAVSATVDVAPGRARGFVNAVLRKLSSGEPPPWPDVATGLSYPEWVVDRLRADLGDEDARNALLAMNKPATVNTRPDGYVQDPASQWVADAVEADAGDVIIDSCAAPGGKATAIGARVLACDVQPHRVTLIRDNARRYGHPEVQAVVSDGRALPVRPGGADRVLVDAPCSGLGVLGRRPDARWRIEAGDVARLARLQRELLNGAIAALRPGGMLVYSVCTLTATETTGIDEWLAHEYPRFVPVRVDSPWTPLGRGGRVLPQDHGTDGMYVLRLRAS